MRLFGKGFLVALLALMVIVLVQCGEPGANSTNTVISAKDDVAAGKKLADTYCRSCHQFPDPSLLDKKTWREGVLPVMGLQMGIKYHVSDSLLNYLGDLSHFPKTAIIDSNQMRQIVAYYTAKAPEHLPVTERPEPIHQLPIFKILPTPAEWVSAQALTSCVKIDQSIKPHRLLVADGMRNKLIVLDDKGKTINTTETQGPIVDLVFRKDNIIATTIGSSLWSNFEKKGSVKEINIDNTGKIAVAERVIADRLGRPVSTTVADFNADGKPDYLVAQFGKMQGRLSWFEETGMDIKEHVLRDKPGAIRTLIDNKNIWALFAQGEEAIFKYTNDGKGNFKEQVVLSFPPSYGSSYFDLIDFNGDGFKDIIYTCGDNGDYSQIPKPYHGVYIYLNDGKDNFKQQYFYPINGCYKAIAKDFDGDGDLDIATISEFPAKDKPWQAFMYFENKGSFNFKPYTLPLNIKFSNGITIDAADIDGDGKTDLLLGNGYVDQDPNGSNKQPLFLVLKNINRRVAR